ncbi:TerD family protein (plasmid) [Brevibacillus halotolerans]|nr:TerD family protein [Brevibacillus halotolerans]
MNSTNQVAQTVSLTKGGRVSLTKDNPNLDSIHVGLGWDVNNMGSHDFDLDASVFLLGTSDKVENPRNFVFFNNLESPDGSVRHTGDNLTGEGDGDDESIKIQLSRISPDVQKIVFTVTIYEAKNRGQNFGQVENAFIRIADEYTGHELIRYDLTENFSMARSVIVGELYRHEGEWKFNASGVSLDEEVDGLCRRFGVR